MDKTVSEDTTKRRAIDWESVEREYRAGIRSLADIGSEFGVSAPGILKKARVKGWERDLSAKIKAKAEAKVNAALVNSQVNAQASASENKVVEANAQMLADKVINQREDVKRLRNTINSLFDELDSENENKESGLADRVRITKALAETTKIAIELERRVLKLDEFTPDENGVRINKIELVALT